MALYHWVGSSIDRRSLVEKRALVAFRRTDRDDGRRGANRVRSVTRFGISNKFSLPDQTMQEDHPIRNLIAWS